MQFKNNEFIISLPFVIYNIINLVALTILRYWIHKSENSLYEKILVETLAFKEESRFLAIFYKIAYQIIHLAAKISVLINLISQKRIANFINTCGQLKIRDKFLIKFKRDVIISLAIVMFYFAFDCLSQFFTYYKINCLAVISHYIETFPFLIMLNTLIATKNFEILVITAFDDIASDLNESDLNFQIERKQIQKSVEKYRKLCELCEEFNKVFGSQLTYMVCYSAIILTLRVSTYI